MSHTRQRLILACSICWRMYCGMPIRMAELLATLSTPSYLSRHTVIRPKYVVKAKRAIRKAFTYQLEDRCFSLVEIVSTCPINWGMTPQEAIDWTEKHLLTYYKLGEYKSPDEEA